MHKSLLVLTCGALWLAACSTSGQSYCQLAAECDEDLPFFGIPIDGVGNSDDSVAVCAADTDGYLGSLRQNQEQVCHDLANAYDAWIACIAAEDADCDAWYDDECEREREDIQELRDDADNRCNE